MELGPTRVEKKQKMVGLACPLCLFWTLWRARNGIAFRSEAWSIQKLKISFVSLLWAETKSFLVSGPTSLVAFVDWVGCK